MNASNMTVFAIMAILLSATTVMAYQSASAQAQVGVDVGAKIKVGNSEDTDESNNAQQSAESHSITEIRVSVAEGKASIKIQSDGNTNAYVIDTENKTEILASIKAETGLSEEEIEAIWDFEIKSKAKSQTSTNTQASTKASVEVNTQAKSEPKEKAIAIIAELKQRLAKLEQRFQILLVKLETGTYFGNTLGGESNPKSYTLSLDGKASAISEMSSETEYSGEIYLESIISRDNQSKFKVTGGEIIIDGETYQVLFGKTRSSLGFSGEKDTMIVICQVLDSNGDTTTMKLLLKTAGEFDGNFGVNPEPVNVVMPSSKIASKWFLEGSGTVTLA